MPSFGGVNIFGSAVMMNTSVNPRRSQINAFFGVNGLEAIDGGSRGGSTVASGLLYGSSASALAASEALFRSFDDGIARTLVDTFGASWAGVRLQSFQPWGRVKQSPYGYYFRPYQGRFLHLA
jgi:hypothetical protein